MSAGRLPTDTASRLEAAADAVAVALDGGDGCLAEQRAAQGRALLLALGAASYEIELGPPVDRHPEWTLTTFEIAAGHTFDA